MRRTVLLVDDDTALLHALRRTLRHEPYTVLVAESPTVACGVLARQPIDAVVSDEGMPGMSGTQFLARVHAEYPETVRIMLTGQANLDVAMQAINAGHVYRFFTKPCDPQLLASAIRQALLQRALLLESRRLLHTVRRQSVALEALEDEVRGLTHVDRDSSGAIVLSEVPTDIEALLAEAETELAVAEARLERRTAAR